MSYTPTVFKNGQAPALNATEMNKIGNGIKANADDITQLNTDLETKADVSHTHNYAGSSSAGGVANNSLRLSNTSAIGSSTKPIYFNANGVPVSCSYDVNATVPSNAKFTDTTYSDATTSAHGLMTAAMVTKLNGIATGANAYTLPTSSSSTLGGVKTGSNITNSSGTISLTKANVTSALGYTPPTAQRGVQNNLTSTSTTDALTAAQGKVLNDKLAGALISTVSSANSWSGAVSVSGHDLIEIGIFNGTGNMITSRFLSVAIAKTATSGNPILIYSGNTICSQFYVSGTSLYIFNYSGYGAKIYGH